MPYGICSHCEGASQKEKFEPRATLEALTGMGARPLKVAAASLVHKSPACDVSQALAKRRGVIFTERTSYAKLNTIHGSVGDISEPEM